MDGRCRALRAQRRRPAAAPDRDQDRRPHLSGRACDDARATGSRADVPQDAGGQSRHAVRLQARTTGLILDAEHLHFARHHVHSRRRPHPAHRREHQADVDRPDRIRRPGEGSPGGECRNVEETRHRGRRPGHPPNLGISISRARSFSVITSTGTGGSRFQEQHRSAARSSTPWCRR